MIKFTFDINKVIEKVQYKHFNSKNPKTKFSNFNSDLLIKQNKLIRRLPKQYQNKKEYCVLISLYNAYPNIFNWDINNLAEFTIKQLNKFNKFSALKDMSDKINIEKKKFYYIPQRI